jgi:hypothetical protein
MSIIATEIVIILLLLQVWAAGGTVEAPIGQLP